jgi:hypothetical protein
MDSDDDGETDTEKNPKPGEEQDPKEDPPKDPPKDPTPEEIFERFKSGELLTKDRVNELITDRLDRDRETRKAEEEEERRKAAESARAKALKDQENYKELSATQATQLEEKDKEITNLKQSTKRISDLEKRLEKIVEAQIEGLEPRWKNLLSEMSIERRAEWVEQNPDLVNGSPEGVPPSPRPDDRSRQRKDEAARQARMDQQRASHSRL